MRPAAALPSSRRSSELLLPIRQLSGRAVCQSYRIGLPGIDKEPAMATQIKFGTSGWRAVVAEEFTFANVRRAVTGVARYVKSQRSDGACVIVGRDPRF